MTFVVKLLTAEEAIELIRTAKHKDAQTLRNPDLDRALIELLERGELVAYLLPDNRLAFRAPNWEADDGE